MEALGEDEFAAAIIFGAIAVAWAFRWYSALIRATSLGRGAFRSRVSLALVPLIGLLFILIILRTAADPVVRGDARYIALFLAGGGAWMAGTMRAMPWLGISWRDDALDRRNGAAAISVCGALLSTAILYAAANVGVGPTIWTTFGPALLGWALWLMVWISYQLFTRADEQITVGRDESSALRLVGVLLGSALILSHGAAGDYHSARDTARDLLIDAAVCLPLLAVAAGMDRACARAGSRSRDSRLLTCGAVPACLLILLGAGYLLFRGVPR